MLTDRRGFLVAASSAALTFILRSRSNGEFSNPRLNIVLVESDDPLVADIRRGVAMGVDEALRSAQLFGGSVKLTEATNESPAAPEPLSVFIGRLGDPMTTSASLYF